MTLDWTSNVAVGGLLPLLLSTLLLVVTALVPRLAHLLGLRWPLWLRVAWQITAFALLTILLEQVVGSPLQPRYHAPRASVQLWQQFIEAGWWLVGARIAIGLARLLVVLEGRPRETRIISDLLAGAIYVATILAIVNFAFTVPIRGLLATSGVIAIVLGLALQSTLSDVFSGIAVGLEKPYKPGDLLWVEGGIEGHVVQVNWRSTQIATGQSNIAVIPNSIIAKARLVNRSAPTLMRGDSIEVRLDANAVPEQCQNALLSATRACRLLRATPPPGVACTGLQGDGAIYEISFSVDSSEGLATARTELFTQIHRHLHHAGIALALAGAAAPPQVTVPTVAQLLAESDLFGSLEARQRDLLVQRFRPVWLQSGDRLIHQGDAPQELFMIASGVAEITIDGPSGPRVVYRMSPGESLGAIGVITNAPFSASATALTAMKAYRLDKADIATAIKAEPALAAALDAVAQRGQAALRRTVVTTDDAQLAHPDMFLGKLRGFLHLLGT
nr:mechanosensitive ion channel family protein [uncultured Lichenicoccus sp.]